ncbi:MAG: bifunctional methylenetetrahydrofolate dehydrogenase/methenyltetrahydrofolate cyclohydrolase FolD [Deltaproteobacteria bacterium]|nr:MAG: bifunctional methylenetetrahydrofolate dehydrogenase/methenyltetrahydrofolate cyclohydrolase FolD [Deltaproteobacteria bacterium]
MPEILDGRVLSKKLNKALKVRVASWPRPPGLAVILVGRDPASEVYVHRKGVVAGRIGFLHRQIDLPSDVSEQELLDVVHGLNQDDAIDGILVQLPLPKHLDSLAVMAAIDPAKDVDGFTAASAGCLAQGRPHLVPCTPKGVMVLLEEAGVALSGKHAVVIGRSNIVGRPMAQLLEQANCTVTVCHSRTQDVEEHVRRADIVVAAVGRPEFVRGDWVKPGAVVIDVGINRLEDGRLVGDVHTAEASEVASAITPVPGGVGPMTIAMLMANTALASAHRQGLDG